MRPLTHFLLVLIAILSLIRAIEFLACLYFRVQVPLDTFNLEAKMVHLAWRVQHGVALYPDWQTYPYVANFFTPVYFVVVGWIARAWDASLGGLYLIGRGVTAAAELVAMAAVAVALGRKYGRGAAVIGGLLSLGSASMDGFGFMCRPDLLGDTLGFVGFLLAVSRSNVLVWPGGAALVLAVLTKQTAGVYLLAAIVALGVEGRWRRAAGVAVGSMAALAAVVGLVQLVLEPRFLADILAEGRTPWSLADWSRTLLRLAKIGLDMPVLAVTGLVLWGSRTHREPAWASLAAVMLTLSLITSAKTGADLNYFLGLRLVAALAGGTLWHIAWRWPPGRFPAPLIPVLAVTVILGIQVVGWLLPLDRSIKEAAFLRHLEGRELLRLFEQIYRVAENPSRRILTDSGMIDIRQGERTLFADPWLFRLLVHTGRIRPDRLVAMVDAQEFEGIITTHDLFEADYATYDFGLPMPVAEAARRRYRPAGLSDGLYFYEPRRAAPGPSP